MASVIVDNWTLETAINNLHNLRCGMNDITPELVSLVETMVLWDEVCYFEKPEADFWKDMLTNDNRENPFCAIDEPRIDERIILDLYSDCDNYPHGRDAAEYMVKSNVQGMDCIVHEERVEYLKISSNRIIQRLEVMNTINASVKEFYKAAHIRTNCTFRFPAIFEYIQRNTDEHTDYIDIALALRHEPQVNRFRDWLNDLDEYSKNGYEAKARKRFNQLQGVLDGIIRPRKQSLHFEAIWFVLPFPSLSFNIRGEIKIRGFTPRLTFVKSITKTAIGAR